MYQWFRGLFLELGWLIEDVCLLIKHPTRKKTRDDISYQWYKLWSHILFHPWYQLTRGVRNVYLWFTTIWRNDYWDHFYLEDMIYKQLKEMEKLWRTEYVPKERSWRNEAERGFRCQHARIWKRIRWTIKLMEMYRDEYYTMKAYDEHNKLFPTKGLFGKSKPHTIDEFGVVTSYICEPSPEHVSEHYRTTVFPMKDMDEKCFKLFIKNFAYLRSWWH